MPLNEKKKMINLNRSPNNDEYDDEIFLKNVKFVNLIKYELVSIRI